MNRIEALKSLSGTEALSKILENQLQKVDEEIIYRLNKSTPRENFKRSGKKFYFNCDVCDNIFH